MKIKKKTLMFGILIVASIFVFYLSLAGAEHYTKYDITNATGSLEYLHNISVKKYYYFDGGNEVYGVNETKLNITHPELIRTNNDGEIIGAIYPDTWALISAIQELEEENTLIKASLCKLDQTEWC
jgi:hypothetical protein